MLSPKAEACIHKDMTTHFWLVLGVEGWIVQISVLVDLATAMLTGGNSKFK